MILTFICWRDGRWRRMEETSHWRKSSAQGYYVFILLCFKLLSLFAFSCLFLVKLLILIKFRWKLINLLHCFFHWCLYLNCYILKRKICFSYCIWPNYKKYYKWYSGCSKLNCFEFCLSATKLLKSSKLMKSDYHSFDWLVDWLKSI